MTCRHAWISHAGWWRCGDCGEELPRYGGVAEAIAAARAHLHPEIRPQNPQEPEDGRPPRDR